MSDKEFIGKVTEKVWNDGNVTLSITLNDQDKEKLSAKQGFTTIKISKSKKGTWYGEIDNWKPQSAPQQTDDLPF